MDVKIIPAVIFTGIFLLFLQPVSVGILNLGNGAGMAVSALLVLICLFYGRFRNLIGHLWDKPAGRLLVSAVGILTALCVILAVVISIFMIKAADDPPEDENTTVVVLGCKVRDGGPSLMLARRINAAYDYLSAHEDVCAVVSGGQGSDESISEARCMKDRLVEMGIAPERIFMEDKSANTEENLRFSKEIIKKEGLPERITLVTDGYHQLRAEMIAKEQGTETYNLSAATSWYLVPTYWVREWFGVVHYKIFG